MEDRALAAKVSAGDTAAFEELYDRHHRGILSLCRHLLRSPEESEDALQHTFVAAFRELSSGKPPAHPRAWLYAVARNRCLSTLRDSHELASESVPAATAGLSEEVERRDDLRALLEDIGRLPEEQRAALLLTEVGDLEQAEVAEVIGCPRKKVRALVYQARSTLSGWREARDRPCREVRTQIASARGGQLRRRSIRRHLQVCVDCEAFERSMVEHRRKVALVLPVLPGLALKEAVLESTVAASGAAAGVGASAVAGAASGEAAGAAVAGGAAASSFGITALKIGAAAVVLGGGVAASGGLAPRAGDGTPEQGSSQPAAPAEERAAQRARDRRVARVRERREQRARRGERRRRRAAERPAGGSEVEVAERAESAGGPSRQSGATSGAPAPAPTPAPAPAPPPQDGGGEGDLLPLPQTDADVEIEVDPPPVPDALP